MTVTMSAIKGELIRHKRGIIIGAIAGGIAAFYAISQGADLVSIAEAGKGIVDSIFQRQAPLELAKWKVYLVFMTIGGFIGLISHKIATGR